MSNRANDCFEAIQGLVDEIVSVIDDIPVEIRDEMEPAKLAALSDLGHEIDALLEIK